jgi:hypothetical protein
MHWTSPLILVVALIAALLIAFVARMIILSRNRRDAMKIIREIIVRAATDTEK